jgi:hypothetical protein
VVRSVRQRRRIDLGAGQTLISLLCPLVDGDQLRDLATAAPPLLPTWCRAPPVRMMDMLSSPAIIASYARLLAAIHAALFAM